LPGEIALAPFNDEIALEDSLNSASFDEVVVLVFNKPADFLIKKSYALACFFSFYFFFLFFFGNFF